jgi:hypothetical protein
MNEQHFKEIETTLLYVGEARKRAEKAVKSLTKQGAKTHLIDSMRHTEVQLKELHRSIMHGTYFAAGNYEDETAADEQMTLS